MKKITKYAGMVVFYYPNEYDLENVKSYLDDIEKLYIIDNTDGVFSWNYSIPLEEKMEYIPLGKNLGLGEASNIACRKAYEEGFDYILILDQDTNFEKGAVRQMIEFNEKSEIHYAIICPNIISVDENGNEMYIHMERNMTEICNWTPASGSLTCLKDFWNVDGFESGYFIEHLDVELGIKLHLANLPIVRIGNAIMKQRFGNSEEKQLLWKKVHPQYASPTRVYYVFRNQQLLKKKYGTWVVKFANIRLYKGIIKILLYEDNKLKKMKMAILGTLDGKKGMSGACMRN